MAYNMVLSVILKGNKMDKPCDKCLVSACCTKRCEPYAMYIFSNADAVVSESVEDMSYHDAIQHILMVENCYLEIAE